MKGERGIYPDDWRIKPLNFTGLSPAGWDKEDLKKCPDNEDELKAELRLVSDGDDTFAQGVFD